MYNEASLPPQQGEYVKVPGCTGLYRHTKSGRYYGVKKLHGKRRERSLATSDRKIAERRHKEWIANLEMIDSEVEKTTLRQLTRKLLAVNRGKSQSTQYMTGAIIRDFEAWWSHGLDFQVRNIRPSHLEEWLATHERRLKNTSYNRYAGVLKQLFEVAVKDRIIAASPFEQVATRWKKPQKPVRRIPTIEQFEAIVECIRSQRFTDHAHDTADFIEFLGCAGLGQAEASSLRWCDVDWALGRLSIRRHKTDTWFYVPIYSHLRPLMERLRSKAGSGTSGNTLALKIKDGKKALNSACKRLGLPSFSQRNLRQSLIMRLWKAGVDIKLISKWQGHQDGGQLILDTYTEVFGSDDADYELQQFQKLHPGSSNA
jgi:integrase